MANEPTVQGDGASGSESGLALDAGPAALGLIRVVVLTDGDRRLGGPAPMAVETTAALARLGDPVELLRAQDLDELSTWVEDPSVDLVLFDRLEGSGLAEMLGAVPAHGPPTVVVVEGGGEAGALDAFRAGASECVEFGDDYEALLPVVLLEQARRWRADRQRMLSERRIQWLEDLNGAIVSEMPAGLVVMDSEDLIVAENREFARLFPKRSGSSGTTPEFLAARVPAKLVEAVMRLDQGRLSHAASVEGPEREFIRVEESGGARAYEIRHRRLEENDRRLIVISDVTESTWLSERLESLERDTQDIIENINSALIVVDPDGRVRSSNPAAMRILGGCVGSIEGRAVADWFPSEERSPNPIEACLASGTRCRGTEVLLHRPDGEWVPVGISCSPRLDQNGERLGVVAVFQDLSEIKELELQVRQAEKMASIGQLAAGVAHEVNNPMGFIRANLRQMSEYLADFEKIFAATRALRRAAAEGDLEVIRAAAEDVDSISREIDLDFVRSDFEKALLESGEGAERIRHIVKDLRDFSRPDTPRRTQADVNQAVDSTANIVSTMMNPSVTLEKDYGELPKIDAYPMQLKQVFMNLLVNAHQAIEELGEGEPGRIRIQTESMDDEIIIRISDTGPGISAEAQSRIFEPFFTTKPVGAGTGLGLSTSFKIVERHGGSIGVQSEPGEGTLFEVRLPASSALPD